MTCLIGNEKKKKLRTCAKRVRRRAYIVALFYILRNRKTIISTISSCFMTSIFRVDIADEFVVFRVSYTSGSDVYSLKSGRYMSNQHQVFWVIVFCCTSHIYTRAGCAHTIVLIFRHNRHMYNIYTRRSDFLLRVLLLFFVRKLSILNKFKPSRRCIVTVDVYLIWKKFQRFRHACDFELMSLYIGLEEKKTN